MKPYRPNPTIWNWNHGRRKPDRLKSQPAVMKIQNYHTTILSLPEEMIEEILTRLPVESLLRFKCVSKSWRSLIGNKSFVKLHHKTSMKNPSFPRQRVMIHTKVLDDKIKYCSVQSLLDKPSIHPSPLYDPPHDQSKPFRVVGCYNGLVCILEDSRTFFLWNPSTRISKRLPEIADRGYVTNYGFGWIESSDECKVFGIVFDRYDRSRMSKVYSSKKNSWKTVGEWDRDLPNSCEGVFVGGKLYWKTMLDIVLVDLKREEFGRVELPFDKQFSFNYGMGELGGCLCLLYHDLDHHQRGVRVWVLKDNSWERVMTLTDVLELLERPFSAPYTVGPNGEIKVFYGSTFLVYYPQHCMFRCPNICYNNYDSQHLFVESLVSPLQLDV